MPVHLSSVLPDLALYLEKVLGEVDRLSETRRRLLDTLASYVAERVLRDETARLTFICTHNSRRSHLSQIWAQTAAFCYGISRVETFSGGTEGTAFNPRAVAAIQRAGFRVDTESAGENPVYLVRYSNTAQPMRCFSKVYDQAPNPTRNYAAVMTCSAADAECPVMIDANARIPLLFEDPKAFDGTNRESEMYDKRCRQIAREMMYVFQAVAHGE